MGEQHSKYTKRSFRKANKRKRVQEDEEKSQTLTINRCNFRGDNSRNNRFTQIQLSSYDWFMKRKNRRVDSDIVCDRRQWSHSACDSIDFIDKIVFVSYNILGVENASKHHDMYPNVPFKYMKWENRRAAIHKELAQYDPSIICFQEVDCYSDLYDALQQDGYEGFLKARTGDAQDGCATFWNRERFKLLHEESIEFQSFGLRNNVAQFCVLKMNDGQFNRDPKVSKPTRSLVVGNIHVLFNPNRGDMKLGQIRLFLERAHSISEEWGGIPVLLGGDFNCVPKSAAYQYISSAELDLLQQERKKISGQLEMPLHHSSWSKRPSRSSIQWNSRQKPWPRRWTDEELEFATGSKEVDFLQHSLNLRSAYHGVPGDFATRDKIGEPLATSFHSRFMGTVDYIWHSDQLVPIRVLETLSRNALEKLGGLPSKLILDGHTRRVATACF